MAFGFKLEVWGDYALFTRPEMSVERVSYDVITPSAARGFVESIYYLGCREFAASFKAWPEKQPIHGYYSDVSPDDKDLGFMLYDMDYSNPESIVPMFYRAHMVKGTIDVAESEVFR